MHSTPKKIKGFTILEVIIVLSLVGIISAIGIPNFNSWNKSRIVKGEAERVRDLVTSINSQVQRGLYGFGQFEVDVSDEVIIFSTQGILMGNMVTKVLTEAQKCKTTQEGPDYWDHFGGAGISEVRFHESFDIKVDVSDRVAVCFSKDGSLFGFTDESNTGDDDDASEEGFLFENIFICSRDIETCQNPEEAEEPSDGGIIYVVSWSRFGNVKLEKWNGVSEEWIVQ
tara:strand:- start:1248 stop:1928 length:681 start_codon:yes stop_codon:yes gene_type:complete